MKLIYCIIFFVTLSTAFANEEILIKFSRKMDLSGKLVSKEIICSDECVLNNNTIVSRDLILKFVAEALAKSAVNQKGSLYFIEVKKGNKKKTFSFSISNSKKINKLISFFIWYFM